MRRIGAGCIVLVLGLGGCFGSGPMTAGKAPGEPLVTQVDEVDRHVGLRVRVVGEAENAWTGAMVVCGDLIVHLDSFRRWPDAIVGERVEAIGRLERERLAGPTGAQAGPYFLLRQASYLLID